MWHESTPIANALEYGVVTKECELMASVTSTQHNATCFLQFVCKHAHKLNSRSRYVRSYRSRTAALGTKDNKSVLGLSRWTFPTSGVADISSHLVSVPHPGVNTQGYPKDMGNVPLWTASLQHPIPLFISSSLRQRLTCRFAIVCYFRTQFYNKTREVLLLVHVKVKAHCHKTPNVHGYVFPRAYRAHVQIVYMTNR
jgi:hypothetical protein